ncbi:MAG: hypothetical protein IJ209_02480 [Bacteroidaceae bacterium]|nr:hypothetical protein [Bacteroidaceae bacterium]
MKKETLILLLALLAAMPIKADPSGLIIPLIDVPTTPDNGGLQRSPILVPVLYLDGYTLMADDYTLGSTIQILDEDGTVVFSTFVYIEGDIELPETLSGTYTIQVLRGSQTFEGTISL